MDPYPDKDPPGAAGPLPEPSEAPEVLDIFRHAWPVIWEKPLPTVLFVLALAAVETLSDLASSRLLEPFAPALQLLMSKGPEDIVTIGSLNAALSAHGGWRLALGAGLPLLVMPFVSFSLCRAALSLWDGYAPAASDLALAAGCYAKALVVFLALSIYGAALGCLTAVLALPFMALLKSHGLGAVLFLGLLATAAGLILWLRFVWPMARRYFFLQFFVYFRMSDHPGLGGLISEAVKIDRSLRAWPSHLNALCALTLAVVLGAFILLETVAAMASGPGTRGPLLILSNAAYLMAFLWPAATAAGFYRLCLRPAEDVYLPGATGGGRGGGPMEDGGPDQGDGGRGNWGRGNEIQGDGGRDDGGRGYDARAAEARRREKGRRACGLPASFLPEAIRLLRA
ncbi:MAG: hypothetical protein LBR80_17840 [Deltaproteobacteria bacterium]|jgi:hypothetical protein|nr:hypothetical protein [Deltaproteobacteria bacterium]